MYIHYFKIHQTNANIKIYDNKKKRERNIMHDVPQSENKQHHEQMQ